MIRLMCSEHPEEVAAVKSELFKAGIRSEIRKNPVTAALRITRLELWVENENAYFLAHNLYSDMQARGRKVHEPITLENMPETSVGMAGLPARPSGSVSGEVAKLHGNNHSQPPGGELREASALLEREIIEVLKRQDALSETCATLRSEVERLGRSLGEAQAAAEKKAAEFADVKSSLERELAERARSEEQLKSVLREVQSRLKLDEETVSEGQKKLETTLQQLQTQQATVVDLRKEIVSREQEWDANNRLVSKAQAELAVEKESRIAAEEKAAKSAQAQEDLERQLVEQKDLQAQLRASIGNINSLRGRLLARRTSGG